MSGPLALVGGAEWTEGCTFDQRLLEQSGSRVVTVIPTAAAYEDPEQVVETARAYFAQMGARVEVVAAMRRTDTDRVDLVEQVRAATFVYLSSGTPMHLRSVLFRTPLWDAVTAAWQGGAVLAASGEAAAALSSHMVDPHGGAFTVGLNLVDGLTVVPRWSTWSEDKWHRTVRLAPKGLDVVGIDERTALIGDSTGWQVVGQGSAVVMRGGRRVELSDLPVLGS